MAIESPVTNREELVAEIQAMPRKGLMNLLEQYRARIAEPEYNPLDPERFWLASISSYPNMTDAEEMAAGRLLELNVHKKTGKPSVTPESEAAREYLIGSNLRLVLSIAGKVAEWAGSVRMHRDDFFQIGSEKVTKGLSSWDWRKSSFTNYIYPAIKQAMVVEFANDKGRSYLINSRILALKQARDFWAITHKGEETVSNATLAQAMFLYFSQPELKLSDNHQRLRDSLITLGEKLNVFPEVGVKDRLTMDRRIERTIERMDLSEEMEKASHELEGDKPMDGEDGEASALLDLIGKSDVYNHLDMVHMRELIEAVIGTLEIKYQEVIRFMILDTFDGSIQHSFEDLAKNLGVNLGEAKKIYTKALTRFRRPNQYYYDFRRYLIHSAD